MHAILATILTAAGTAMFVAGMAGVWSALVASRARLLGASTVDGWDWAMPIVLVVLGVGVWILAWLVWEGRPAARRSVSRRVRQRFGSDRRR